MEDPAKEDRSCFAQSDIAHPFQKADIGRTGLRESILMDIFASVSTLFPQPWSVSTVVLANSLLAALVQLRQRQ